MPSKEREHFKTFLNATHKFMLAREAYYDHVREHGGTGQDADLLGAQLAMCEVVLEDAFNDAVDARVERALEYAQRESD